MSETDPHIHVERSVAHAGGVVRNVTAAPLGRAADAPAFVTSGCGPRVPYAMTATRPQSVTCLACRDHARAGYLRLAGRIESFGGMPGTAVTREQAVAAAGRLRDLARRFSTWGHRFHSRPCTVSGAGPAYLPNARAR